MATATLPRTVAIGGGQSGLALLRLTLAASWQH